VQEEELAERKNRKRGGLQFNQLKANLNHMVSEKINDYLLMPNGYAAISNKVIALKKERRKKENFLHKDEVNHIDVNVS
jgi:hypothetical protein